MDTKLLVGIMGVTALLLLVGCNSSSDEQPSSPELTGAVPVDVDVPSETAEDEATAKKTKRTTPETASLSVEITATGFSPDSLTVHAGDTVTWLNTHSVHSWPASATHPLHREYPGSDIAKCSSTQRSSIFDACQRLTQGGSYSFTFMEKGSWTYHDHLNPTHTGTIIVE